MSEDRIPQNIFLQLPSLCLHSITYNSNQHMWILDLDQALFHLILTISSFSTWGNGRAGMWWRFCFRSPSMHGFDFLLCLLPSASFSRNSGQPEWWFIALSLPQVEFLTHSFGPALPQSLQAFGDQTGGWECSLSPLLSMSVICHTMLLATVPINCLRTNKQIWGNRN